MDIQKELGIFKNRHQGELNHLLLLNYLTIKRKILESETMPQEKLIELARHIKPLIRLRHTNKTQACYGNLSKIIGEPKPSDTLVWLQPFDLRQSFFYNFNTHSVVETAPNTPLPVENLEKVAEFSCYHRYGGYYQFLRPGADEVIQQLPQDITPNAENQYAFELMLPSLYPNDVYEQILDRHVSTVIVYKVNGGLPTEIAEQAVIFEGQNY